MRLHDEIIAVAAEWSDPVTRGRKKLQLLLEGQKDDVLDLLENSLASPRLREVPEAVKQRLCQTVVQDVTELTSHLNKRAEVLAERAKKKLTARGEKEAVEMKRILEEQRSRILKTKQETEQPLQLSLFAEEELRQLEADRRHWNKRLSMLTEELVREPARIEATYEVKAMRVEPVGIVYLYPVSG